MILKNDRVRNLLDHQQPTAADDDLWRDFAEHITLSFELNQRYRHSLGRYSRFFRELAVGRFFGTRCAKCDRVYTPPRPLCPRCQGTTKWHELTGAGTLETYTLLHFNSAIGEDVRALEGPLLLAYVLLDGSDTLFPHLLRCRPESVVRGLRVRIAYRPGPVSHPLHLMHFVPADEEE